MRSVRDRSGADIAPARITDHCWDGGWYDEKDLYDRLGRVSLRCSGCSAINSPAPVNEPAAAAEPPPAPQAPPSAQEPAQRPPTSTPPALPPVASAKADNITVTGCISRSPQSSAAAASTPGAVGTAGSSSRSDGGFMLSVAKPTGAGAARSASPAASSYKLDADDSKLSPHVGHKVEVTGSLD